LLLVALATAKLHYKAHRPIFVNAQESYGELALKNVEPEFSAFEAGLKKFDKNSEPGHVKNTRGPLANARTMLDVFAYAYPSASKADAPANTDVYLVLIDDLTEGHNLLGDYSDLGSVNYSKSDKEKLLGKCLDWKAKYEKHAKEYDYPKYVKSPSKSALHTRKKSELSGHFWGNVKEVPSEKLTGIENIALLQYGQLTQVIELYDVFRHYTTIWNEKVHEKFHDYRKDLRYLHQVGKGFKQIYKDEKKGMKAVELADAAEHNLGPINNRIEAYFYYEKKGDKGKAAKLKDEVEKLWKKEKDRLQKEDFLEVLKGARSDLIKH